MRRGTTGADLSDKYLVAGVVAFVSMTVMNVIMLNWMASTHTAVLPAQWNWAYRHLQLDGFAALFIFGVSLRTLPVFLGKPQPSARLDSVIFPLLIIGLVLRASFDVMAQDNVLSTARIGDACHRRFCSCVGLHLECGRLQAHDGFFGRTWQRSTSL